MRKQKCVKLSSIYILNIQKNTCGSFKLNTELISHVLLIERFCCLLYCYPVFVFLLFQTVCTIISGFLHYLFLSAFFIMLCEGVELIMYIVLVFHVRRMRETVALLVFGWGNFFLIILLMTLLAFSINCFFRINKQVLLSHG